MGDKMAISCNPTHSRIHQIEGKSQTSFAVWSFPCFSLSPSLSPPISLSLSLSPSLSLSLFAPPPYEHHLPSSAANPSHALLALASSASTKRRRATASAAWRFSAAALASAFSQRSTSASSCRSSTSTVVAKALEFEPCCSNELPPVIPAATLATVGLNCAPRFAPLRSANLRALSCLRKWTSSRSAAETFREASSSLISARTSSLSLSSSLWVCRACQGSIAALPARRFAPNSL